MLRTADLDYSLPEDLIATTPVEPRDSARLLVVSRSDPARLEHRVVRELPEILRPPEIRATMSRDLMVVNATRVLPARFKGYRADTKGQVEGLYLGPSTVQGTASSASPGAEHWTVLLKMRRMKPGVVVRLFNPSGEESSVELHLIDRTGEDGFAWIVRVESSSSPGAAISALDRVGLTPVPPYILASRKKSHLAVPDDRDRSAYQTVYSSMRDERPGHGSVAAPTAGLHFTPELLARLGESGVERAEVTLDVSLGTFKPVETEFVEQHPMHSEWCHVPGEMARAIQRARSASDGTGVRARHESDPLADARGSLERGRVIAIGTTAARTLESFDSPAAMLSEHTKETRLLITPGYQFKHVDALLTNFHLPQSTLLSMVGAFLAPPDAYPAVGIDRIKAIYAEAIRERYRFYSFGDAMLILP